MAKGDPRYIGYAEAVVLPFASTMTADLLLVRGQLRQFRHQFEEALEDFSSALRMDPQLAQAHAWRGAIFLVQANYPAAEQACQALSDLAQRALAGACQGLLQAYTGNLQAAQATLQLALQASPAPENQLWLHTRLGEVAGWRGQPAQAEQHFKAALKLGLDDGYLLAAWSDFLLDTQRPAEVLALLAPWESSDGLLLRLAEAETLLKLPAAARHVQALANRFDAARLRGDATHRAEEARFELRLRGNPQTALVMAQANYAVQREPRDARILLEAALAAKDPAGAQAALDWLRSSGFQDPRMMALAKDLNPKTP
jgi:tetratricopeptide (TPR) repeat protein